MTQIAWTAFTHEIHDAAGHAWLLAEIEERLRLGDSFVLTEVPPDGETLAFADPQAFRCWYDSLVGER